MSNISTTWIVIGVLVVLVVWIIMIYNGLVAMRQRVNQSFADIDVQLKQRHDLSPNLVETVKGYAGHERGTLEAVIKARQAAVSAPNLDQKIQAENMLSGALRQLFALSESYPDLKANANFQQLQGELIPWEAVRRTPVETSSVWHRRPIRRVRLNPLDRCRRPPRPSRRSRVGRRRRRAPQGFRPPPGQKARDGRLFAHSVETQSRAPICPRSDSSG